MDKHPCVVATRGLKITLYAALFRFQIFEDVEYKSGRNDFIPSALPLSSHLHQHVYAISAGLPSFNSIKILLQEPQVIKHS